MKKTVLITGGSSGIGLELGKVFAKNGYDILLISRKEEELKKACNEIEKEAHIKTTYIVKDLSSQNSATELYNEIKEKGIKVDVLINNAGFSVWGKFCETSIEEEIRLINLNIVTLVFLTKLFLQDMVKANEGMILNIASTAAFEPGPLMSLYFASKSFVLSFTEAIQEEYANTNIKISALCPGATKTNFDKALNSPKLRLFENGGVMSAKEVAVIGYNGLISNKRTIIAGMRNKILVALTKITPKTLILKIVKYLNSEA